MLGQVCHKPALKSSFSRECGNVACAAVWCVLFFSRYKKNKPTLELLKHSFPSVLETWARFLWESCFGSIWRRGCRNLGRTSARVARSRLHGDRHRATGRDCSLCPLDCRKGLRAFSPPRPVQGAVPCVRQLDIPGLERKDRRVEPLAWSPFLGPFVPLLLNGNRNWKTKRRLLERKPL